MDDLLADFMAETRDMMEALGEEVVAWEADPSARDRLDSIFRFVHTVKGNCGFFDLPRLARLSHAAEDALAAVRAEERQADRRLVDAVLAVIDRIGEMIEAMEQGEELPDEGDELLIRALEDSGEEDDFAPDVPDALVAASTGPGRAGASRRSVRLPVALLDRVMSGVSDMVLARNELSHRLRDAGFETSLGEPFDRLSATLTDLRDAIARMRMHRIDHLFVSFSRLVRDLSAELGKQVMIDFQGGDVELDREIMEMIRDPLVHIIRNAIDHGIETPAERRAAGKREIGMLLVAARQSGNQIRIFISDDGRGIDTDRLVEKAIAAGVITPEAAARLQPAERNMLIFEPGLSTAREVTAVSGRGVGMDVVRANIEKIGGTLSVYSTPGSDTRVMINLPLTLSIVPALTVSAGGQRFAFPRSIVEEIILVGSNENDLVVAGGKTFVTVRGERIGCIDLGGALGLPETPIAAGRSAVLARLVGGDPFILAVDHVFDHQDLVVKPIAPVIMQTGLYVGTSQIDDGSTILMLDLPTIGQRAGLVRGIDHRNMRRTDEREAEVQVRTTPVLIFVGLDGVRRAIGMNVVSRVEAVATGAVHVDGAASQVVIDDMILPLAGISGSESLGETLDLFRLDDGQSQLAYAIRQVVDTAAFQGELTTCDGREDIAGIALIDGVPVEIIDNLALFARYARVVAPKRPPVCRMPASDRWLQDFMRPLVEKAGYQVIDETDEAEADVAVALVDDTGEPSLRAARAILLRTTPEPATKGEGSIYRYDRAAVLAALRAANAAACAVSDGRSVA